MNNLITIENQNAVVTVNTIEKFAGIQLKSIQSLVRDNIDDLRSLDSFKFEEISNRSEIDWTTVSFSEIQVTYLLTLMKNTEQIKRFKFNLVQQFFKMRDEIQTIKIEAIKQAMLEDRTKAVAEAKKLNTYDVNGLDMITVGKYAREYAELSPSFVWDALEIKGLVDTETKLTKFRKLPKHVPEYIGSTIKGSSTPIYLKQVIDDAIATYEPIADCQDESDEDISIKPI